MTPFGKFWHSHYPNAFLKLGEFLNLVKDVSVLIYHGLFRWVMYLSTYLKYLSAKPHFCIRRQKLYDTELIMHKRRYYLSYKCINSKIYIEQEMGRRTGSLRSSKFCE